MKQIKNPLTKRVRDFNVVTLTGQIPNHFMQDLKK